MARKVIHSFSLRPETLRRVRALAELHGEKLSTIADQLLCDALDQAEIVSAATTNPVVMAAVAKAMSEPGVLRSMLDVMRTELSDEQLNLFTPPVVRERSATTPMRRAVPAKKTQRKAR